MMHPLRAATLVGFLVAAGQAQSGFTEQLLLTLDHPSAVVRSTGTELFLGSASATRTIGGLQAGIYRWVLSVDNPAAVQMRLTDPVWVLAGDAPAAEDALDSLPLWEAHSPQVRGNLKIVLLDIIPWRMRGGRLEVLKGGTALVTLRHPAGTPVARPGDGTATLANTYRHPVTRRRAILRRAADPLPIGGRWLKIPLQIDGLYQITADYLSPAGVDPAGIDLPSLRLFSHPSLGRPMSDVVGAPLPENMIELPLLVRDGGDGQLGTGDGLVFYGQGPRGLSFEGGSLDYTQNPYHDEAYVWLHIPDGAGSPGLRMATGPAYDGSLASISSGRGLAHHEIDLFNGFSSGPVWHQEAILRGTTFNLTLPAAGLRPADSTRLVVRLRGGNQSGSHRVALALNQTEVLRSPFWGANGDRIFDIDPKSAGASGQAGDNLVTITNISTDPSSQEQVWFDWAQLSYGRDLTAVGDLLEAAIEARAAAANVALAGFTAKPLVADISAPEAPVLQQLQGSGGNWSFTPGDLSAGLRFVAATEGQLLRPDAPELYSGLSFTDLRQPGTQVDYIIITVPAFSDQAQDLADIHSSSVRPGWRLTTRVVQLSDIYKEFSGGLADPYALRAFLRYAYENWATPAPRLVVLFGDGDYDYRNLSGQSQNLLPTIQVDGINEIFSRSADDRFVYLDSVAVAVPLPDMGIGRIPVSTAAEADAAVAAIRSYMVSPEPGAWRQQILMAADDPVRPNDREESFVHDSEQFASNFPNFLEVSKVYLTEFAEHRDPATNAVVKPQATEALLQKINQGVSLINYIGHGSASQWAQEGLLRVDRDRRRLQPGARLPVWYAGTCAWGRFDELVEPAMSELLTASEEIAGIAVISATRAVFSADNTRFVRRLFENTFPNSLPATVRLGEILMAAKLDDDDEKFHLFGDPAIRLTFPAAPLDTLSVAPDTLQVLGTATYQGAVSGTAIVSGQSLVTILDAPVQVTRTYRSLTGELRSLTYKLPGAAIFRGSATLANGQFSGAFIIPKDINYSGNPITVVAYAWSLEGGLLEEQIGALDNIIIRGTAATTLDSAGPLIAFYHDERLLQNGEALVRGSALEVEIQDPLGINLTGEVGHSIRLWLDEETAAVDMNSLFQFDLDSHTAGRFNFTLDSTLSGRHELWVEAWDGANNRSRQQLTLNLDLAATLAVTTLFNYPNPFQGVTRFFYNLSVEAEVAITIYTLNGIRVRTLSSLGTQSRGPQRLPESGQWDGSDAFGDGIANGTYLYRFRAQTLEGDAIVRWGRLTRLR